jgi:hypothetical protein
LLHYLEHLVTDSRLQAADSRSWAVDSRSWAVEEVFGKPFLK